MTVQSNKQRIAGEYNFKLFQLSGCVGALRYIAYHVNCTTELLASITAVEAQLKQLIIEARTAAINKENQ